MKRYLAGVLTVYVFVAVFSGVAMSRAMPALNGLGAVYVAVTWPAAMICSATWVCFHMPPPGSPLANAFFTFKDTTNAE